MAVSSCCGLVSLRIGSLAIAILLKIVSGISMILASQQMHVYTLCQLRGFDCPDYLKFLLPFMTASGLQFVLSSLLLAGVLRNNSGMLVPWLIWNLLTPVISLILGLYLTIEFTFTPLFGPESVQGSIALPVAVGISGTLVHFFLVVLSQWRAMRFFPGNNAELLVVEANTPPPRRRESLNNLTLNYESS